MLVDNDMHVEIFLSLPRTNQEINFEIFDKKKRIWINIHLHHFLRIEESHQVEYKQYEDREVFPKKLMYVDIDLNRIQSN
jgi:hypothetical protein